MIRYYAYYNHGGYKDLYLGNSEDSEPSRYYLPLLPVYEEDESMADKVAEWKKLPSIINLSTETCEYNYPTQARVMISHAGYKLQYRLMEGKGVFALRDIGGKKDLYGRNCPFVLMMVADTDEDKKRLEKVCFYVWKNIGKSESLFSSLFVNDFEMNGLRFDIEKLNEQITDIVASAEDTLEENTYNRPVPFFVLPDDIRFVSAFEEQQITKNDVAVAYNLGISSKRKIFRYSPPEAQNGTKDVSSVEHSSQKNSAKENNSSTENHSFRKALGFATTNDFNALYQSHQQLLKRVELLEKKIQELEKQK